MRPQDRMKIGSLQESLSEVHGIEAGAVLPFQNGVVCLLAVREAVAAGVPVKVGAWKAGGLDRQKARFSDAESHWEGSPVGGFRAEACVDPVMPVACGLDLGKGLLDLFSVAKDPHFT